MCVLREGNRTIHRPDSMTLCRPLAHTNQLPLPRCDPELRAALQQMPIPGCLPSTEEDEVLSWAAVFFLGGVRLLIVTARTLNMYRGTVYKLRPRCHVHVRVCVCRTKYIGGHTDVCAGVATASTLEQWGKLMTTKATLGSVLVSYVYALHSDTKIAARLVFTARQHSLLCSGCISYRKSVRLSVRLSVCPSITGTVSKRLKLPSWGLHCRIAPWL